MKHISHGFALEPPIPSNTQHIERDDICTDGIKSPENDVQLLVPPVYNALYLRQMESADEESGADSKRHRLVLVSTISSTHSPISKVKERKIQEPFYDVFNESCTQLKRK